jgi:hypothetical protein
VQRRLDPQLEHAREHLNTGEGRAQKAINLS